MKKVIVSAVIGVAMAVAGSVSAADGAFKLGASQMDAVSGGGYTAAGGTAGVAFGNHGAVVFSDAWAKGKKSVSYSSQLAVCTGGHCVIAASSGSKAVSRHKYGYRRYH